MSVVDNLYLDDVSVKALIAKARAQANQAENQQRTQTIIVRKDYAENIPEYIREKMGDASLQTHREFEQEKQQREMHYANKHTLAGTPTTDEKPNILEPSNIFVTQTDLMEGTKLNPGVKLPEKTNDDFETASGAIIKAFHLENKPYTEGKGEKVELEWITPTGEHVQRTIDESRLDKEAWWIKERAKDVAQGAIATVTFPADIMMLLINRDKLRGLSPGKIGRALWESAKTGELEAELAGGLLAGGAINAIIRRGIVGGAAEAATNSVDDIVKTGAGTTDDIVKNLDDIVKAGAKSNTDDMLKFTVKGPQEQTIPAGAKTSKYINVDLGDVKIEGDRNYLRIKAQGKTGEIYNKGGLLDIRGELWRDKNLLKHVDKKLALYAPEERHVIKPILDEFMNLKWAPQNPEQPLIQGFLNEWSGFLKTKELALYDPDKWREIAWLSRPGATTKQKLLLKNAQKKIIYVDAPPEWKAMKKALQSAGAGTSDVLIAGAGAMGPINLEMANIFGNKDSPLIPTPQIPESMQRALKKGGDVFEMQNNQHGTQQTQISLIITQKKIKQPQTQTPNTTTTPIMTYAPELIKQIQDELQGQPTPTPTPTPNPEPQITKTTQITTPSLVPNERTKPKQMEIPKVDIGVSTLIGSIAIAKLKNARVKSKRRFKLPSRGSIVLSGGGGAFWKKSGRKNKNKIFSLNLPKPKNPFALPKKKKKKKGGRKNGIF